MVRETPREINYIKPKRRSKIPHIEATKDILSLLTEEVREGVLSGLYFVRPQADWWSADKPVVVGKNGKLVTGKYKNSKDPQVAYKENGWKINKSYQQALEDYFPTDELDNNPNIVTHFNKLVEAMWRGINGSPQQVKIQCPHPDVCPKGGGEHVVAYAFKVDPHAAFKLIENLKGRAAETQNINVDQRIVAMLNERVPTNVIEYHYVNPDKTEERRLELGSGE